MTEFNDEILFPVNYSARKIRCIVEELNSDIYIQAVEIYRSDFRLYIELIIDDKEIKISELINDDEFDSKIKNILNKCCQPYSKECERF